METKRVLITGATSGIGKETARALSGQGFELILVGRDEDKLRDVRDEIRQTGSAHGVEIMVADLSSLESIRTLAAAFLQKYDRLDVLINNAGLIVPEYRTTSEGYEYTFALNHLGYFLLTGLLLKTILAAAPARIINVSSQAHHYATIDFDDLMLEKSYSPIRAYAQSKLANVLFSNELARRLDRDRVTVNSLHPGSVRTGFGRELKGAFRWLMFLSRPFLLSPRKAAQTPVFLASSPQVEGITGQYFIRKKIAKTSAAAQDPELARILWEKSEELTQFKYAV